MSCVAYEAYAAIEHSIGGDVEVLLHYCSWHFSVLEQQTLPDPLKNAFGKHHQR